MSQYVASFREVEYLRCHKLNSGYHGVYEHLRPDRPGSPKRWVAAAINQNKLPAIFKTPTEAARAIASAWGNLYGEDWHRVFAARTVKPWLIVPRNSISPTFAAKYLGRGYWSTKEISRGGYHGWVWELGDKTAVWPRDRKATCFASKCCAKAGIDDWIRNRAGLFASLIVRQTEGGPVRPPWATPELVKIDE